MPATAPSTILKASEEKLSASMRKALLDLRKECLLCPMCENLFEKPVSLIGCGHTFCSHCIDVYSENASNTLCPIPSCKMPLSMKKGSGRFRNTNSTTQSLVSSWMNICSTLEKAPDRWWQDGYDYESDRQDAYDDDDDDSFTTAQD